MRFALVLSLLVAGLAFQSCIAPIVPEAGTRALRLDGFPDGTVAEKAMNAKHARRSVT